MEKNVLSVQEKRNISVCNFNEHTDVRHPDRVMEEHDLIYIREGEWSIWQEGSCYNVKKGDVILLHAGHHHYGKETCVGTVKTIFVHFNCCESDCMEREDVSVSSETENAFRFPVVVHCGENSMAEKYLRQLVFSYWSEDRWAQQKASAYLDLLLSEISEAGNREKKQELFSFVDDIKMQIKNTPDRFFSVKELADQYGFSERTISSRFKKATGKGIHAWQLNLKCQMAEELMANDSEITLKEVARVYGFCDEYHFSKCYKKQYGFSPKKSEDVIRQKNRGGKMK